MQLSQGDLARLLAEMHPAALHTTVRHIWRDGDEGYGVALAPDDDAPICLQLEVSLTPETGRLVALQPERVDRKTLKLRRGDDNQILSSLRRHLEGARLTGLRQVEGERIILLDFDARRDDGLEPVAEPRLAIELTGRRTNLVLSNGEGEIIMVHRHGRGLGGRDLVKGAKYIEPERRGQAAPATALSLAAGPPSEAPEGFRPDAPLPINLFVALTLRAIERDGAQRSRRTQLRRAAKRGLDRSKGRLKKLEREISAARDADTIQREGELLSIHANEIQRGARQVELLDTYESPPTPRIIALEPDQPLRDQAQARFKRAKKMRRGLPGMELRCGAAEADAEQLEALLSRLDATSEDDEAALDRLERELERLGCLPKAKQAKATKLQENQGPRRFRSRDGLTILVGRSNRENDRLTIQTARGNDLFFHVRGSPGSHVIVRSPRDGSVPLDTLLDAALLAVHYSKQRGNARADVSYTPRKYVRKPRGAKPGLVQISNERVLQPGADHERLRWLLNTAKQEETS